MLCADILLERERIAVRVNAIRWEVEIAPSGDGVSVKRDRLETEFLHHACAEGVEETVVSVVLNEEGPLGEERVILHVGGVLKVDEDGDALSSFGMENGVEETLEVELREGSSAVGVFEMCHGGLDG